MFKKIQQKIKDPKGETLVELLVAILISALSVAMLVAGISVSSKMNASTKIRDEKFYEEINLVEQKQASDSKTGTIKIQCGEKEGEFTVKIYGKEICSYKKENPH